MNEDRPILGILLMIGFCAIIPLGDAIAKFLGESVSLITMILGRFMVQGMLLLPLLWWSGTSLRLPRRVFLLAVLRSVLHLTAMAAMFTALRFMPLADTVAIAFVMPFMLLILGHFVLGEEVGIRRMAACGAGFAGTLLVIQPSFSQVGNIALLPVVVAVLFAFHILITRQIARHSDPIVLQTVGGLAALPMILGLALVMWPSELPAMHLAWPVHNGDLMLLVLGSIIGTVAHLLMTWSLRFAPSATLAPMQYLEIPFATLVGWLVFLELPNGLAALGIIMTVAAGLYVIYREQVTLRQRLEQLQPGRATGGPVGD